MTMFAGAMTALVTPFRDGAVDEPALRRLVTSQIEGGIHGLVPCGTTGESANLSAGEYERVVRLVVEEARGRVPVVAGAGTASTAHTIELARLAKAAGADGLLGVTPYYGRPTVAGMVAHYRALTAAVDLPLIVYNVPSRTGVDLTVPALERLAENPQVVAIKEASNTVQRSIDILERFGSRFVLLSGDDLLILPIMAVGAQGAISVISNLVPDRVAAMVERLRGGDLAGARALHTALVPLMRAAFIESNPAPAKAGLSLLGRMAPDTRLPILPATPEAEAAMRRALSGLGVLS